MSVTVFLGQRFNHTHENEFFDFLARRLEVFYSDTNTWVILVGNVSVGGRWIDACIIKYDAIILLEFKNYGGELGFSENDIWTINGGFVKMTDGYANPYLQARAYREDLIRTISNWLPKSLSNFRHTSAAVVFHQGVNFDRNIIPKNLSTWFYITDGDNVVYTIDHITSNQIRLSKEEANLILEKFGFKGEERQTSDTGNSPVKEKKKRTTNNYRCRMRDYLNDIANNWDLYFNNWESVYVEDLLEVFGKRVEMDLEEDYLKQGSSKNEIDKLIQVFRKGAKLAQPKIMTINEEGRSGYPNNYVSGDYDIFYYPDYLKDDYRDYKIKWRKLRILPLKFKPSTIQCIAFLGKNNGYRFV